MNFRVTPAVESLLNKLGIRLRQQGESFAQYHPVGEGLQPLITHSGAPAITSDKFWATRLGMESPGAAAEFGDLGGMPLHEVGHHQQVRRGSMMRPDSAGNFDPEYLAMAEMVENLQGLDKSPTIAHAKHAFKPLETDSDAYGIAKLFEQRSADAGQQLLYPFGDIQQMALNQAMLGRKTLFDQLEPLLKLELAGQNHPWAAKPRAEFLKPQRLPGIDEPTLAGLY